MEKISNQSKLKNSHVNGMEAYHKLCREADSAPEVFWAREAQRITWKTPFTIVKDTSFQKPVHIRWFSDGVLNVSYNCLDRHLESRGDQIAYYWEPDHPDMEARKISYQALHEMVCRMANVLKKYGVKKGDRVTIYLPMIPEAVAAMLACTRIGAIHSLIFAGFSPDAIVGRVHDCESNFVITADEGRRHGKTIPLKANIDEALAQCPTVKKVLVVQHTAGKVEIQSGRDVWWHEEKTQVSPLCNPEWMNAEDPLFILYTSGSTGKPKGVLHTTGGYLVYVAYTHEIVFDYHKGDVFWCTADVGWVTGHSYIVYGPLVNGATSVLFEGVPSFPDNSRFWKVIDKYQVNIFYTAPTALRSLMREGDGPVQTSSRKSLRLLGSVGEPINPEAWLWYYRVVGESRCPIVDTWWQTETGGILISPLPGATDLKPGSATLPLPGIKPILLTTEGQALNGPNEGILALADSWPGQMRTLYKDHKRFEETYFSSFPGYYFTGDGCKRDADGYFWITGRVDDVLNVSGHCLGTAEIESALVGNSKVAEAAVVGFPHSIKGQGVYAFVTLKTGITGDDSIRKELVAWVAKHLSAIAKPDAIQFAPALPKTRSGKIMRRILRKIVENQLSNLGDTSTLADPAVITELVQNRLPVEKM